MTIYALPVGLLVGLLKEDLLTGLLMSVVIELLLVLFCLPSMFSTWAAAKRYVRFDSE